MISFEQVFFSYSGNDERRDAISADCAWTLSSLDFTVKDGAFFGIAGPTGSGKSTLLQHMNGLLNPSRGRVTIDGIDIADKKAAAAARRGVGLVFQYPERQLFAASVLEDIAFGPRNLGLSPDAARAAAHDAMERVGLSANLATRSPFGLSEGQRRRAALAGILAMHPNTLVLDEPTAGLDPYAHALILDLIESLHDEGMTVVMASHNMDDLAKHCSEILVLSQGAPYRTGTPQDVFDDSAGLEAIGLATPHAQQLADALRRAGMNVPEGFYDETALSDAIIAAVGESNRSR